MNRRQIVTAIVLPLLLLAVVYMGVEKQERVNDGEVDMDVGSGGSQARPMGADGRVFAPGSRPKVTCDTAGVLDRHSDRAETRREVPKHERVNDANSKGHQEVGGRRAVPNPPTSQGAQECTPPLHFPLRPRPCAGGSPNACRLFDAIRQVESAGNDLAVGDKGVSRGPFQIKRAYWREAVAGTDAAGWSYDKWVWNRDRAEYVVWLHWCKVCPKELRAGNVEMLARRHRLPNDPWRKDNDKYWRKVKENING